MHPFGMLCKLAAVLTPIVFLKMSSPSSILKISYAKNLFSLFDGIGLFGSVPMQFTKQIRSFCIWQKHQAQNYNYLFGLIKLQFTGGINFLKRLLCSLFIHFSVWNIILETSKLLKERKKSVKMWSHRRKWEIYMLEQIKLNDKCHKTIRARRSDGVINLVVNLFPLWGCWVHADHKGCINCP